MNSVNKPTSVDSSCKITSLLLRRQAVRLEGNAKLKDANQMTFDDFAAEHVDLVSTIKKWDLEASMSLCAGLLLCPKMHAYTYALEILIHAICVNSTGSIRTNRSDIAQILNSLSEFLVESDELPRAVLLFNAMTEVGNRRFLTGTWETPEFWVQQAIDSLTLAPRTERFDGLREQLHALLSFSEAAMERNGLQRYTGSLVQPQAGVELPEEDELERAVRTVRGRTDRLTASLEAFTISAGEAKKIGSDLLGNSRLEHRPFIQVKPSLLVWALPTATSLAIRTLILKRMQSTGNLRKFSQALRTVQGHSFVELLRRKRADPDLHNQLPPIPNQLKWIRQTAVEFDGGRVAHILLLHDDLEEAINAGLTSFNSAGFRSAIEFQIHLSRSVVRLHFGLHREGMTVVVMAGLGRGFALPPFAQPPNWHLCAIHLSDAVALMWLGTDWLTEVWSVKSDVSRLSEQGLHVRDKGDDVRILGYWRAKDRIVPLDVDLPADNVAINIDKTFAGNLRAEARLGYDEHASYKPSENSWFRVAKLAGLGHFRELRALPIYGSLADAMNQKLAGVVETKQGSWWIELHSIGKNEDFHISYVLWDATMQWCGRILPALEKVAEPPPTNVEILVEADLPPDDQILEIPASNDLVEVVANDTNYEIRITLKPAFLRALAEPTNRAEKQLVKAIIDGAAALCRTEFSTSQLFREIVPNDEARFAHLFAARTHADELSDLPHKSTWLITDHDSYNAALGIGAELGLPGRHTIIGKKKSQKLLHKVVDILWERLRSQLRLYNRPSLIKTVLQNLEAIRADELVWERTAAALINVYNDRIDVLAAAHNQSNLRNRTSLTSRALIEMAICECPLTGGMLTGRSDYSLLIGLVNTLLLAAFNSDAIQYDLADPDLEVWPNGEVGISTDFNETVLVPYQQGRFEDYFRKTAADYANLFRKNEGKAVDEVFDTEFLGAWKEEFGFSIEQLLSLEEVLVRKARESADRVVDIGVTEFLSLLQAAGIDPPASEHMLESLVLLPRDSWALPPEGFALRDIEPWHFGRRLSMIRRPLLSLSGSPSSNAQITYGAGLVHNAFSFTVTSTHSGTMSERSFTSARMQRWIGGVNNKNGTEFNETVREIVRSAGLRARSSVQMTEFGVDGMGDIAVLAWTQLGDAALVIECKHLRFARTVGEVGEQLRRFRGQPGDDLYAHMRRLKWLSENSSSLKRKLDLRDGFRAYQLLVTETLVPMAFVRGLPIPRETVVSATQLPATIERRPLPGEIFLG